MRRKKIACIGAGNIGGEVASHCAILELGNIFILDTPEKEPIARGKAADILHASALTNSDVDVVGTSDYKDIDGADVCIVSAGLPRKSTMSRDELFDTNARIIIHIASQIRRHAPESFVIVITNPLDVMAYTFWKATGFPSEKVVGMAGMLDSARFRAFIADAVGCSVKDVNSLVLGSHGDLMVPVISYCSVNGVPVRELIAEATLQKIVEKTRFEGGNLVQLLGTSAYYAAAKAACQMAESYLKDQKRLMPCSIHIDGHYGLTDTFLGVPVIIGNQGVERVLELKLSSNEINELNKSAQYLQQQCRKADILLAQPIL